MKKIIFATHNEHKAQEIQQMIGKNTSIVTLKEEGITIKVIEDGNTLKENAFKKASEIHQICKIPVIADDTGLEVDALNGSPGVNSARYSGENASDKNNLNKLMKEMADKKNRTARFRTVICYIENNKPHYFEGIVNGKIIKESHGLKGFGYDPLFIPNGYDKTFAEMSLELKNTISHRGKAFNQFIDYVNSID